MTLGYLISQGPGSDILEPVSLVFLLHRVWKNSKIESLGWVRSLNQLMSSWIASSGDEEHSFQLCYLDNGWNSRHADLHTLASYFLLSLVEGVQIVSSFGWHEGKKRNQHIEDSRIQRKLTGFSQDEGHSSVPIHPHLSCVTLWLLAVAPPLKMSSSVEPPMKSAQSLL